MNASPKQFYEFGSFRIDVVKRLLLRDGEPVALKSKCFETLLVLVEARGQVLEKDELMRRVWPDSIVEESNLTVYISALRKALNENPQEHRYIVTVPGRGYSFVAEVTEATEESAEPVLHEQAGLSLTGVVETSLQEQRDAFFAPDGRSGFPALVWRAPCSWRVAVVSLLPLGLAVVASYWWLAHRREPALSIKSLVVLPLRQANTNDDESLGMEIADVVITKLGSLRQISVRPTSAIFRYKDQSPDPLAVGREQRVDAVLEGSIHGAGENIRVTMQLVSTRDGAQLWAEQFDGTRRERFAIEDAISQRLAQSLRLRLSDKERQFLAKHYTENQAAHRAYLKGRHFWNKRDAEGMRKAIECFWQAIDLDPEYALAYVGLADTYAFLGSAYFDAAPPKEDMLRAKAEALKALELDSTLAEAHCALGFVKGWYEWDWPGAEQALRRALELNPNYATGHQRYGWYLLSMGRLEEALAEMKRAQELDPLSRIININVGAVLYYQQRYDEALKQFRQVGEMDPSFRLNHVWPGWAYAAKGAFPEAIAEFQQEQTPWEQSVWGLGYSYAKSGQPDAARAILIRLEVLAKQRYVSPSAFILIHTALGEKEQAFAGLEKAYDARDFDLCLLKVDPKLDSLRADPRFTHLLRRVGLAP